MSHSNEFLFVVEKETEQWQVLEILLCTTLITESVNTFEFLNPFSMEKGKDVMP